MILLESHDRFDDLVELDPATGQLLWYSKRHNPDMATRPVHGSFSQLNSHRVCLYRQADTLYVRVDDLDIELTDDTRSELVRGKTNVLMVLRGDVPIFCLEYKPYEADEIDQWRMYMNPFIEEEHFDFGLFVCEVIQNADRRNAIYR